LNFFYIGTYRAEKNMKIGQICLLLFFLKNVYGGGGGGGGATAPPPPPLDFTMVSASLLKATITCFFSLLYRTL
jgi:hypothetical protein